VTLPHSKGCVSTAEAATLPLQRLTLSLSKSLITAFKDPCQGYPSAASAGLDKGLFCCAGQTSGQRTGVPFGLPGERFSRCEEAPQVPDQGALCLDSVDLRRSPGVINHLFSSQREKGGFF